MRKITCSLFVLMFVISCTHVKDIAYLQQTASGLSSLQQGVYEARVKPKDLLYISIVSSEPEASRRFNLVTPNTSRVTGSSVGQETVQGYLVENDGTINLPVLGTVQVNNLTTGELKSVIENEVSTYFSGEMPVVTVRIMNFTVNILGEVNSPGKYETANERMTIFDGLALAKDMTIYGKRDNVKVLREEDNGEIKIYTLNLNDAGIFNSPAFFLQQNDVVYVEPNQSRANSSRYGTAESFRISTISALISVATLIVAIFGVTRRIY